MNAYIFRNFPIATVAFGNGFQPTNSEQLKENITLLKSKASLLSQGVEIGQKYSPNLKAAAVFAGKLVTIVNIVIAIVGEVDKLYKELKKIEGKIFNAIFEGKLQALNRNLKNLLDSRTPEIQKIAEIVSAVANLDELLPIFANEDSIFRQRYYYGAPLFLNLCAILKAVCLIAEYTPDYNTANLHSLKQGYQNVLDWYRIKCIGGRMASCYVQQMLPLPFDNEHDWLGLYNVYPKYYKHRSFFFAWRKYGENLGGTGWRLWFRRFAYYNLIDTWDIRRYEEVKFEPFILLVAGGIFGAYDSDEPYRAVLAEYRQRVERVMLDFFNEFDLM
ncbi:uncharacterized protein LOC110859134 [Folsomia candida]|uniref:uncharacterized protein LOC110859134 n=1 Tax=Folsomia candida TaxID=158441 RepID=UPI000B9099F6|nr:uncharacterized protein LOC110859134 [Folsomia candida]